MTAVHLSHGLTLAYGAKGANKSTRDKTRQLLEQFYENTTSNYQLKVVDKGLFAGFRLQSFPGIDYEGGAADKAELPALRQEMKDFAAFLVLLKK